MTDDEARQGYDKIRTILWDIYEKEAGKDPFSPAAHGYLIILRDFENTGLVAGRVALIVKEYLRNLK